MGGDCGDILWFNCAITGLPAGEGKAYEMPLRIKVICVGSTKVEAGEGKAYEMPLRIKVICVGSTKVEAAIGINSSYC